MKVVISGFYGSRNLGDEAILSAIVSSIEKEDEDVEVTVLSLLPDNVRKEHGVSSLLRADLGPRMLQMNWPRLVKELSEADLHIIGGGGLLQDAHYKLSIFRYLYTAVIAKLVNTPVMFYGIGVGPINDVMNEILVRRVVPLADLVYVRDQDSRDILKELGINNEVKVCNDPVYSIDTNKTFPATKVLQDEGIEPDKKIVGVSVRDFNLPDDRIPELASFLDLLTEEGYSVLFIPFGFEGSPSDLDTSSKVRSQMESDATVLRKDLDPEDVAKIVESLDLMVGMRLHSVILAARVGVPILGLSYLPKVQRELSRLGYPANTFISDTSSFTYSDLTECYENLLNLTLDDIKARGKSSIVSSLEPARECKNIECRKVPLSEMVSISITMVIIGVVLLIKEVLEMLRPR